jgi:hypothetical protein
MEKKIKKDGQKLREFLASMDRTERRTMKKKIIEACKIEYYTIDNWRYEVCNIHPLAKEKIEEVAGRKIFSSGVEEVELFEE